MINYDCTENETPEYATFVEKFKPKKTTDDCYTPDNVYEAVKSWAVKEYGLEGRQIIRPFHPGGDYIHAEYPENCIVLDNPPFSILSQICKDYDRMGVDYFLFAPGLTLFSINSGRSNYIVSGTTITYANGALVETGFVTNLGDFKIRVEPELFYLLKRENEENTKPSRINPKYDYPDCCVSAARLTTIVRGGPLRIKSEDAHFIRALDSQVEKGKAIFGAGFILSDKAAAEKAAAEKAAAEKAAAEKAAAEKWGLSEREIEIVKTLNHQGGTRHD